MADYTQYLDIAREVEVPKDGIISRALHNDDVVRIVLFGFDKGQELSEHTASMPAIMHILEGTGQLNVGGDKMDAKPGTWVWMPANMPHTVVATSPLVMLLTMLKSGKQSQMGGGG